MAATILKQFISSWVLIVVASSITGQPSVMATPLCYEGLPGKVVEADQGELLWGQAALPKLLVDVGGEQRRLLLGGLRTGTAPEPAAAQRQFFIHGAWPGNWYC